MLPETFEQFYARTFAKQKAEIAACTDPVKRAELEARDRDSEATWRASWEKVQARKAQFQSAVSDEELAERSAEYGRERKWHSADDENSTYRVINGDAA